MRIIVVGLFLCLAAGAAPVSDSFAAAKRPDRTAARGAWSFADGEARCVSDPVLYKKYKNHGPILNWAWDYHDATVALEFKPVDCDRVVFTMNNAKDGHVFRISLQKERPVDKGGVRAWGGPAKKHQTKATPLPVKADGLTLKDLNQQWVKLAVTVKGENAIIALGQHEWQVTHPGIDRDKNDFTISFAGGEIAIRNVSAQ